MNRVIDCHCKDSLLLPSQMEGCMLRECRSLFRFPPQLALARPDSDGRYLAATMLIQTAVNSLNANTGKDSNCL